MIKFDVVDKGPDWEAIIKTDPSLSPEMVNLICAANRIVESYDAILSELRVEGIDITEHSPVRFSVSADLIDGLREISDQFRMARDTAL